MTAEQINAIHTGIWQGIGAIADDVSLMRRLAKYVSRLVKAKEADPTLMTKEDFFANVDEALGQTKQGPVHRMRPEESLEDFLKSNGHYDDK